MAYDREETIRLRAHAIWKGKGCPYGHDLCHCHQAEEEIVSLEQAGVLPLVVEFPKPATPVAA